MPRWLMCVVIYDRLAYGGGTKRLGRVMATLEIGLLMLQRKGVNLLATCKRSLGDGMNISFWDETWCGESPLKVLFPRVYAFEGDKKSKFAHRINISDWNMVLRRAPRGGVESSQLEDLKAVIQDITMSDNKDGWKWCLASNGFSVASAQTFDRCKN
ncbi:RNA-directed DNA polymerase, eukaryota, Reverse transcriptase zinc-binding domain protein [Artemisia annua]|uniref:RNA-directed DNA polymerase, eukaryota, Reverse transcriptase zinc-binding domain protein n=1 Tax=Artemisia annua TaxID=35608 RepID=A0A2U1LSX9_ARTAN|nr:RNA-directed DNA polymerase, eukaryota, Reverse transcriptase zinc-binding domain protein [Artemisia annua]